MLTGITTKITTPRYIFHVQQKHTPQIYFCGDLGQDTVSIKQNDLLKQPQDKIITAIKSSLNNRNFLGCGGEAEVYRIENTDYCIRIPYTKHHKSKTENILNANDLKINFKVSEKDRINHIRAKLNSGVMIMDYFQGKPANNVKMSSAELIEMSKIIEEAPITSYSKLLKQICKAYEYNMFFDCIGDNVIVNPKSKTFTAIDFYKAKYPESMHPLSHIFTALKNNQTTLKQKQIIAGKVLSACCDELTVGKQCCTHISNFDFYRFIYKLRDIKVIENSDYAEILCDNFSKIEDLKYAEMRSKDVTRELNGYLKVARALIKQLFGVI